MRYTLLAVLAGLSGCATQANYEKMLQSWVGDSEAHLVSSWGPPASVYEAGGSRILTYVQSGQAVLPGASYTTPVRTTTYGNVGLTPYNATSTTYLPQQGAPTVISMSCTVHFTVTQDRISNWSWQGNNCRAR